MCLFVYCGSLLCTKDMTEVNEAPCTRCAYQKLPLCALIHPTGAHNSIKSNINIVSEMNCNQ